MLSVLIPVKDPEPELPKVLKRIKLIQDRYSGIIFEVLTESKGSLWEARRALVERARAPFIFNLDADNIVPFDYPVRAINILLKDPRVGAVALNYQHKPLTHLGFGTSIMPAKVMRELYTWPGPEKSRTCECRYMWRRLDAAGWILATLPLLAYRKPIIRLKSKHTERPKK